LKGLKKRGVNSRESPREEGEIGGERKGGEGKEGEV